MFHLLYHQTASVSLMKANLSLSQLSVRRRVARLSLFHKIYYTNVTLQERLFELPFYVSSRVDHQQKVGIRYSNCNAFCHSFIPCTSHEWNYLPAPLFQLLTVPP
uniref:Putative endonuclease/reverse transcript n=1 Tax=Ixodes ricinus TaxID=34613 RepID=A0A0K8RCU2_IXORI